MADLARNNLDNLIAGSIRTAQMLGHIADVAREKGATDEVYKTDVVASLMHAKSIVQRHTQNLEHVRAIYDGKVEGGPDGI